MAPVAASAPVAVWSRVARRATEETPAETEVWTRASNATDRSTEKRVPRGLSARSRAATFSARGVSMTSAIVAAPRAVARRARVDRSARAAHLQPAARSARAARSPKPDPRPYLDPADAARTLAEGGRFFVRFDAFGQAHAIEAMLREMGDAYGAQQLGQAIRERMVQTGAGAQPGTGALPGPASK